MATTTLTFPQLYAYDLMRHVYSKKDHYSLSQSTFLSFRNLRTTLRPNYVHPNVNNATCSWNERIRALRRVHTIIDMNEKKSSLVYKTTTRKENTQKNNLSVEASNSSKNHSNNDNIPTHEKNTESHGLRLGIIATITLCMSTTNKLLYKMALVPLKNYPFFLAQILTFGYVIVYSSILFCRYKSGIVTREMLNLPKKPFIAIGILEALGLAIGMAAAAHLPGPSIPIINQVFLVWQLVLSRAILKKNYSFGQIVGCLIVVIGVVIAITSDFKVHSLEESGLFWPMVMASSAAFSAGASIIKEFVFTDSKKRLHGKSVDIFVVNTFGSTIQALCVLLLLPILSRLKGIYVHELPRHFKEGTLCFFNCGAHKTDCYGAPFVPFLYVVMNLAFNIFNLTLLKESSALVSSLCTTLSLPLSIWAFTFNLPLLGSHDTLPKGLYVGTIVLLLGLTTYNLSKKDSREKT